MNFLLRRSSLLIKYKLFVWPHLDYGNVIYDQLNNSRLSDKTETIQYKAELATTDAIRWISKEKFFQGLGLESLKGRRWLRRLSYLYKTISTKLTPYMCEVIPPQERSNRYSDCFQTLGCRTTLSVLTVYHYWME